MPKMKNFKIAFLFLIIIAAMIVFIPGFRGCLLNGIRGVFQILFVEYKEVLRRQSPDGKVDAVLMQGNAGATESYFYYLYVVPAGCKISGNDVPMKRYETVFNATGLEEKNVVWLKNKILEVKYYKARISAYRNFIAPLPEDTRYEVEIRETPLNPPPP
jgi:hypothetical protein